jgi:hypothetical protein
MVNQLYFLISVYLVGAFFSILLFKNLKPGVRYFVTPLLGVSFLSFSVGCLIVFHVPIQLVSVFVVLLILWILLYYHSYYRAVGEEKSILSDFKGYWPSKEFISSLFLFSIIATFFVFWGKSSPGSDSTQFEGIGRFLANGGTLKDQPPYLAFLLNGRLLVVGAMHCLNRLYGGYSLYALNPTILIWSLGFFTLLFRDLMGDLPRERKFILIGLFFLAMFLCKNFFTQIFLIHSNAFAMIYFSLAIICLYSFSKSGNESWLTLGSFLMGTATLIRIDMLIFSLLYFVLFANVVNSDQSALKKSWATFFLISFPWRLFTLYYTPFDVFYVNASHIILLLIANIGLAVFSFVAQKKTFHLFRNLPLLFTVGILALISLTPLFRPENLKLAWEVFIKYRLLGQDWFFLFTASLLMLFTTFKVKEKDSNITIFAYSTWLYILLLILMVSMYNYAEKDHSAGRILNHIVPLVVFWVFLSCSHVIGESKREFQKI